MSMALNAEPQMPMESMREWLESRGFGPMQTTERGEGYYTRNARWVTQFCMDSPWERAEIHYRGGGIIYVREQLRKVAHLLDQLGVAYEWDTGAYGFMFIVLTVCDELWKELPADQSASAS